MNYPYDLGEAISRWLTEKGGGSLVAKSASLTEAYRRGATSTDVDAAAYLVSRAPATYAANAEAQGRMAAADPSFQPLSLLDIGTGPGTGSWAATARWPSITRVIQCEQDPGFAALAAGLNATSGSDVLAAAEVIRKSEAALPGDIKADFVLASYMLAEVPLAQVAAAGRRLWDRAGQAMLLIEPGTPQGFARLAAVREDLLAQGAFVLAPCTHQNRCPMLADKTAKDWCHFKTRVQRSRQHMHAKQATVPFEDEAFSYLALSRSAAQAGGARIVAPVVTSKVAVSMKLCDANGINARAIASRDKAAYKKAKKLEWGDSWE